MKQMILFDVPRTRESDRVKLARFKRKHDILTKQSLNYDDREMKWVAIKRKAEDKGKSFMEIIAESCRLYEESGLLAFGKTEIQSIKNLCEKKGVKFEL